MIIRPIESRDYDRIEIIGKNLHNKEDGTGWFTENAYQKCIPFDIRMHKGFVADEEGAVVGFITYSTYDLPQMTPFVSWIAVDIGHHRKGIGAKLLKSVESEILKTNVNVLFVETPSEEAGIGCDYEKTYKFYLSVGFVLDRVIKADDPHNYCGCDMAVLKKVFE
ncbi:MAG: GNAT family N-acetyltransferase [Thermoplasmata archaeon]|nr:GNAT family N-acetyltransferase [Thermoplasmata archaeon]